jgi:hypothetical protein
MKKHNLTQINQIPNLSSSTPAESYSAPLDSFPRASFSGSPPGESGGATLIHSSLYLKKLIVKEINNYCECTQVSALKEMILRLQKESAND